ncbi:MAG: NAD(P)H-binding protein [Actinomycetota bacterium]|nr:NAD(P)H-binding protein [Actinomycetota bacterium]
MPVVVTGANGQVGSALIPLLRERGSEVRAAVRRREVADAVRALGAKVAVGSLDDPAVVGPLLHDAHTVCHLAGGMAAPEEAYDRDIAGLTASVVDAATRAGVSRFLFLSYPGASPSSSNAYLRAKGMAEDVVARSGLAHATVRCTHVYGPGSAWLGRLQRNARRVIAPVLGTGRQRVAPVFVGDVAAVLAAADDRASPIEGTFGLQGPDVVTADELTDLLAGGRTPKVHLAPGSRLTRMLAGDLSPSALAILAGDSLADAADAAAELGVARTPLRAGLAASGVGQSAADVVS